MSDIQAKIIGTSPIKSANNVYPSPRKRIPVSNWRKDMPVTLFLVGSVILASVSLLHLPIDWSKLISRAGGLVDVFADLSHLSLDRFDITMTTFAETITVTILATLYSLVLGLFLGALAARNITSNKLFASLLSAFFTFIRAVPSTVWVLLSLVCLGFGPAPGIVGLSFHAIAFFVRVFAQSFEEVPEGTIEALRATGANRVKIFFCAVLPASLTNLIAWTGLRFEINFSESAILGMVGAGGIGYTIMATMKGYQFGRAGTAILLVFLFAFALEMSMTFLKRKMKVTQ